MNVRIFLYSQTTTKNLLYLQWYFRPLFRFVNVWMAIERCAQTQCTSGTPFFSYFYCCCCWFVCNTIDGIKQPTNAQKRENRFLSIVTIRKQFQITYELCLLPTLCQTMWWNGNLFTDLRATDSYIVTLLYSLGVYYVWKGNPAAVTSTEHTERRSKEQRTENGSREIKNYYKENIQSRKKSRWKRRKKVDLLSKHLKGNVLIRPPFENIFEWQALSFIFDLFFLLLYIKLKVNNKIIRRQFVCVCVRVCLFRYRNNQPDDEKKELKEMYYVE